MVLTCCARSKEAGSAERAERILLNMESLYSEGLSDVVANSRCYSAAITAWARSNSPDAVERAFALVDRMEQNGRNGSPHGKPNAHCYNACIHAIAKSQLPGKARRCREVLRRMEEQYRNGFHESTPSYITYSTIINGGCDVLFVQRQTPPSHTNQNCLRLPFFQHAHSPAETKTRSKRHSTSLDLASRRSWNQRIWSHALRHSRIFSSSFPDISNRA
jgi:hypothetical protein